MKTVLNIFTTISTHIKQVLQLIKKVFGGTNCYSLLQKNQNKTSKVYQIAKIFIEYINPSLYWKHNIWFLCRAKFPEQKPPMPACFSV